MLVKLRCTVKTLVNWKRSAAASLAEARDSGAARCRAVATHHAAMMKRQLTVAVTTHDSAPRRVEAGAGENGRSFDITLSDGRQAGLVTDG